MAVLIIGLSSWVGLKARAVAADLAAKRTGWDATAARLATVQQQFKAPSTTEAEALIAESSRMSALAVPAEDKLTLVDMVGHLAEACSLGAVRVNVVPASDSAFVAGRVVVGSAIKPATYALAVEFVGRFADAQKFVSSLPPSVTLSRLTAARRENAGHYQLILSVYEIDANPGD